MTAIKEVRQFINRKLAHAQAGVLTDVAEGLFDKASPDFLGEFDAETLSAVTVGALKFIEGIETGELRVRVFNPSYQADGWEAPYTVLEVAMSDRPFIVDSLKAELRRQGVTLHHLLHPILNLERGEGGRVARLLERGREGSSLAYELFFIERQDDALKRRELEREIERVLKDVVLATDDFAAMREATAKVHDYLKNIAGRFGADSELLADIGEYAAFLAWLDAGNFIYLGYREYDIVQKNTAQKDTVEKDGVEGSAHFLQLDESSGLGILRKYFRSAYKEPTPLSEISESLRQRITGGPLLIVTKSNAESTVHRPVRMDYIGVKKLDERLEVVGEKRILGLFTSKALSTPVEATPILRRKLSQVIALDGAIEGSHDFKQIVSIFNSMPKEELFWAEAKQLHREIRTIMSMQQERGVRLTVRPDPLGRGLAVMVIMRRDRFNATVRRRIQDLLSEKLRAERVDYQLSIGEDEEQVRFHFFLTTTCDYQSLEVTELEREVVELTRSWEDRLLERLIAVHGEVTGRRLAVRYSGAFGEGYMATTAPNAAVRDIGQLEGLAEVPYRVDLVNPLESSDEAATHLKIYHRRDGLILSEIMPLLENLGLTVIEQISYGVRVQAGTRAGVRDDLNHSDLDRYGIDVFRVQDASGKPLDIRRHKDALVEVMLELLAERSENDRLNALILTAGLDWRQVGLLRTLQAYYTQLDAATSRRFINDTMLKHPALASAVYRYFEAKFKPELRGREGLMDGVQKEFNELLNAVTSLPEDRTLKGLFNIVDATVRTNFFSFKPYISLKIDSRRIESMPEPRPLFEIMVVGARVEGIHLRGGMVARGGIRWSDRRDDFRTEVLGLMKTQMTKNAVIVPVGSKGAFILKQDAADPVASRSEVVAGYKTFIRGLLDLTDNVVGGATVHPQGLVVYDGPDSYLVVAADKGTATFSDLANEVAAEYDFWLGDAFASGGSYGYDHKKEGITARGTWECVARHFREMGVDVKRQAFTAVGIGDMSGDVFGNGMLYTDTIRLQAAFNHQHIFLDPAPDARAFEERKRLFALPRSSWADYDKSLISQGGGVFSRHAKLIALSPEVQELLGVKAKSMSGQDLVKAILKMSVDLLWNGGIGTYVKATSERHSEVGDSSNDAVRIDAHELRARVVGEGGNLGLTQLARIDYAVAGGRINTDAIDNSAGVDMSDHEVNIKILLEPLVKSGELSLPARNRLLPEMTPEVSALVLHNNYSQSLSLSLAKERSQEDVALFRSLMRYLEARGGLNPAVEFLPGPKTFEERERRGEGLTRPELAILLAYSKMGIYRRLLETDFPDEPYLEHYLFDYFPSLLKERYPELIRAHPLRREITATQFTNRVVDLLGMSYVHRSIRETGASPVEVIRAALAVLEILDAQAFLERIFALDNKLAAEVQYSALHRLVRAVEDIANWLLLTDADMTSLAGLIDVYREPLHTLRDKLPELLPEREETHFRGVQKELEEAGFETALAAAISSLDYLPSAMNVIDVSRLAALPLEEAGQSYYLLGERLALGWLRDSLRSLASHTKWEKIALGGLIMDLRQVQRQLSIHYFLEKGAGRLGGLESFLEGQKRLLDRYDQALAEIREEGSLTLASGEVLARLLAQMVESTLRPEPVAAGRGKG